MTEQLDMLLLTGSRIFVGVSIVRAFSTGTIVATLLIKVTDFSRRISAGIPRHAVTNKKDYKFYLTKLHASKIS